jgi:hypothetical protein
MTTYAENCMEGCSRNRIVHGAMRQNDTNTKLLRIKRYIESLCGLYSRIARRHGVDRTYVSRVAKGERQSPEIAAALIEEFEEIDKTSSY